MILYAITLKNYTRDEHGLINYVWATKNQVDILSKMRNNPETRYNFVRIGGFMFSPMDISYIEEKNTEYYGMPIPKYARDRYLEDEKKKESNLLDIGTNQLKNLS